jgi:hypothetical protein
MAVGAVGNGPPFSKARWARPRVRGAGSVHGLFGRGDRLPERVGVANPSTLRSSAGAIVDRGAS